MGLYDPVDPAYQSVLANMAFEHHARQRPRHRPPPSQAARRQAARSGGAAPGHRHAPGLWSEPAPGSTLRRHIFPLGMGASPPLRERQPDPAISSLLCPGNAGTAHSLSPFDRTWYQRALDLERPTTYNWAHSRPSVGLVRPPTAEKAAVQAPAWRNAPAPPARSPRRERARHRTREAPRVDRLVVTDL